MMTLAAAVVALIDRLRTPEPPSGSVVWDNATGWCRRAVADELEAALLATEGTKEREVNG